MQRYPFLFRQNCPSCSAKLIYFIVAFSFFRSSSPELFYKKVVLRNFAKFAGKHLCQSLFLSKVAGLRLATLFKKEPLFFGKFCEISKNTFSYRTPSVAAAIFFFCKLLIISSVLTSLDGNSHYSYILIQGFVLLNLSNSKK